MKQFGLVFGADSEVFGDQDWANVIKNIFVILWSVAMLLVFGSFVQICGEVGVDYQDAYYDFWRTQSTAVPGCCKDENAVRVIYYVTTYSVVLGLSVFGFFLNMCNCPQFSNLYGIVVSLAWLWLTVQNFISLQALLDFFSSEDTSELAHFQRNMQAFLLMTVWFGETFLFLTAAYDSLQKAQPIKSKTYVSLL